VGKRLLPAIDALYSVDLRDSVEVDVKGLLLLTNSILRCGKIEGDV